MSLEINTSISDSSEILLILQEADLEEYVHSFICKSIKKVKHLKDVDVSSLQQEIGTFIKYFLYASMSISDLYVNIKLHAQLSEG